MLAAAAEEDEEVIDVDRLLHEVESAEAHRFHGVLDGAEGGHDDHRAVGIALLHLAQHGDAVRARHAEIGDHGEVAPPGGEEIDGLTPSRCGVGLQPLCLHRFLEHGGEGFFVLDDQESFHGEKRISNFEVRISNEERS